MQKSVLYSEWIVVCAEWIVCAEWMSSSVLTLATVMKIKSPHQIIFKCVKFLYEFVGRYDWDCIWHKADIHLSVLVEWR